MPLLAVDLERAVAVPVQAGDDLDQRGLPGPVVTEDAGDLAGSDPEVDSLEGVDGAIALADAVHLDEGRALRQVGGGVFGDRVGHVSSSLTLVGPVPDSGAASLHDLACSVMSSSPSGGVVLDVQVDHHGEEQHDAQEGPEPVRVPARVD